MTWLSLDKVSKSFGNAFAIRDIQLSVEQAEWVAIVGPSGCGKTTLLRSIAGLEVIDRGRIDLADRRIDPLPARQREVSMVFQGESLYPHLSAFENIAFPLRVRGCDDQQLQQRVQAVAELLDIQPLLPRMPGTLSGGQRQRVAIGRAWVRQPQLCLLDEPFSHLDAHLRRQLQTELKQWRREQPTTTLIVTHDRDIAMNLGDRVAVMHNGTIHQLGSPEELQQAPANEFVRQFLEV